MLVDSRSQYVPFFSTLAVTHCIVLEFLQNGRVQYCYPSIVRQIFSYPNERLKTNQTRHWFFVYFFCIHLSYVYNV